MMKRRTILLFIFSHLLIGLIGFAGGIYSLPMLTAPPSPSDQIVQTLAAKSKYRGEFDKSLSDSDLLHWGQGPIFLSDTQIGLQGNLSPGPDFKLYLSPKFIDTEADFKRHKSSMKLVGDVKTFDNFVVDVPSDINLAQYTTVIVWCESFSEFITAAKYR